MKDEKLTVIGSKSYGECQCVMLPTDKAGKITSIRKNRSEFLLEYHDFAMIRQKPFHTYHLYILSSEEIKEGDWYIKNNSSIHQSAGGEIEKGDYKNCKKIIATTDILLTDYVKVEGGFGSYNKVPRPSDDFIKAFVKAQGKIDKVLVEYEGFIGCSECGREYPFPMAKECFQSKMCKRFNNLKLKVSPDNTITIKPIKDYSNRTCNTCSLWMGDRCDLDLTTKCCTFTGNLADKDYWDSRKKEKTS